MNVDRQNLLKAEKHLEYAWDRLIDFNPSTMEPIQEARDLTRHALQRIRSVLYGINYVKDE